MGSKGVGLVAVVIAVIVAIGLVVAQSSAPGATTKTNDTFQLDLVIQTGGPGTRYLKPLDTSGTVKLVEAALTKGRYNIDSFFDISYVSNIGSSELDGNTTRASFNVDSFFDIEHEITSSGYSRKSIPIEMLASSLTATLNDPPNPQRAIDLVRVAVESVGGDVNYGHVTVLK